MVDETSELPDNAIVRDNDGDGDKDGDFLRHIRERFEVMYSFWSEIHTEALEDDKFVAGDQWPARIRREREDEGRPVLTYNLMPSFTRQIINKVRQEDKRVKVIPVETNRAQATKIENNQGTNDYSIADVYSGIIKNIEHVSRASQAYDTAIQHAVEHGFGFFYLTNEYSKLDPFVQELKIHRVKNSYKVLLDPDAQEVDYRDSQDGFIYTKMRKSAFKAKYPGKRYTEFESGMGSSYDGWYDSDSVRVVQYYYIEHVDDEALMLTDGRVVYYSDVKDILDDLEFESGVHIAKDGDKEARRRVKRPVCYWVKITADEILEGPTELPFSAIPIFAVLGEERIVDGRTLYESAVRQAKDAQMSYNYWRSAAAEAVALAPKAPWVLTARQIAGYERDYENANSHNVPYLLYNHDSNAPMPQRQYPGSIAAAELQNAQQDGADIQTIIGLHDASLGREGNEKSGKAILARQNQGNTSTFHFPDNLSRAIEQMGRLMVEAIPRIYDTQRVMRIRLPNDTEDFVEINQSVIDDETGEEYLIHDITTGKYDVILDSGPSYQTQRQEAAELQMELLKVLGPEKASNIVHLIVKNLGVPGSDEVSAVLRKMLPDQLKSEEEITADLPKGVEKGEDGQLTKDGEPWQPPPTMDQQIAMKQQEIDELAAQAEMAKHNATAKDAEAKMATAEAKKREAEADLVRLQQGGDSGEGGQFDSSEFMKDVEALIRQVMIEHETNMDAHSDATAEQVSDAVVDALERIKAYVDKQSETKLKDVSAMIESKPESTSAEPREPVQVIIGQEAPKPARIKFKRSESGDIEAAEPEYDESHEQKISQPTE